tara:strand:+ start:39 stop:194 length:156 start_codon:yes stop_codon:yes gene_type:complete
MDMRKVKLTSKEIDITVDALQKERVSYSFNTPNQPKIERIIEKLLGEFIYD